jgi:hypothetical protein
MMKKPLWIILRLFTFFGERKRLIELFPLPGPLYLLLKALGTDACGTAKRSSRKTEDKRERDGEFCCEANGFMQYTKQALTSGVFLMYTITSLPSALLDKYDLVSMNITIAPQESTSARRTRGSLHTVDRVDVRPLAFPI